MSSSRGPVRWLRDLGLTRVRPEQSARWEIEHHLAELVDRLIDQGLTPDDARREAERRFGDPAHYAPSMQRMERGRAAMERRARWFDSVRQAVARVFRTGRRHPGFTAGVVATLALGIGANATMYGIVDRLLLQPPAHIVDADDVKRVFVRRPSVLSADVITQSTITYPDYDDLRAASTFTAAPFGNPQELTVGSGETATRARVALAGADFFTLLGVTPRIGRFYDAAEASPESPLTAVISAEYWERAYASSPDVLGTDIELSGRGHTIVGVLPEGFTGMSLAPVDVWVPLEATDHARSGADCRSSRGCWWMEAAVRLRPGATIEAAEAEATRLHLNGRSEQVEQGRYSDQAVVVLGSVIAAEGPNASAETRVAKWLSGVSLIVLLIACANVTNLLLARSTSQRKELAVRLSLGMSRERLVAQMMLESIALAMFGGLVALLMSRWAGAFVREALLPGVSFPDSAVNGRVVGFTLLASILAGFVAGLGPALQGSRTAVAADLTESARGTSGGRSRLRGFLTLSQAAMSTVLLVGAGLFVSSLRELNRLDLGLDVDRLLMGRIEFTSDDLDAATRSSVYEEAARRLTELPNVEAAAATAVPFMWGYAQGLEVPGLDSIPTLPGGGPYYYSVTPGYFSTVGLAMTRGRDFDAGDAPGGERVAVVSATMANLLWPDGEAVGQCLLVGRDPEACTTVVGVVEDAARGGYQDAAYMAYYLPLVQQGAAPMALYVRTRGAAETVQSEVAPLMRAVSPHVRYATVSSMRELLDPQARSWTLGATMFSVFGLLALVLAAIGLYSVLAFDVAQRTREIGIRTALGAARGRVLRAVLVHGGRLAVPGVLIGLGIAALAAPYAADLLFETSPRDPVILTVVGALLLLVSAAASLAPGVRATRVDPLVALRSE